MSHTVCKSFKRELYEGIHDFRADVIKIALFTAAAAVNADTATYGMVNEVSGAGYGAGGMTLAVSSGYPAIEGDLAVVRFDPATWPPLSTFTYRKALLYNASKANRAIMAIDFGSDRGPVNGSWIIETPLSFPPLLLMS